MIEYHVAHDLPVLAVPQSDDQEIFVMDADADEIVRPGENNEIVREP